MVKAKGIVFLYCFVVKLEIFLYKKNWIEPFEKQRDYPFFYSFRLIWAPNAVIGQHSLDCLENVVNRLRTVEALEHLGDLVQDSRNTGGNVMDEKSLNKTIRNAIKLGDINKVKRLIGDNPDSLHTMTPFGTWLHVAAKKGHFEIVEYLILKGIDVNTKGDIFDASSLNVAAGAGHLEIIKYLIEAGAELDVSLAKRNPLFGAIYGGIKKLWSF